ncbi:MAG: hypothetical protein IPL79_08945 [Myxococcales bacterium]|nr:hypothetical protein [Myxococcales bacterium]
MGGLIASGCSQSSSQICGNGQLESGEVCDDGNAVNDDACSNVCTTPIFRRRVAIAKRKPAKPATAPTSLAILVQAKVLNRARWDAMPTARLTPRNATPAPRLRSVATCPPRKAAPAILRCPPRPTANACSLATCLAPMACWLAATCS